MKKEWFWLPVIFLLATAGGMTTLAAENQDRGEAEIMLKGGSRGEVLFPHHRHQEALKEDCQTCHELFPQKRGSIEALKSEGKLEPKYVMNKLCTGCHRQYRREGIDAGPTTCSQCHQR